MFGAQHTEIICNITVLTCPLHLRIVATLPWEILLFGFGTIFADLFHQQSCLNDWNVTMKSDLWKILPLRTTVMLSQMLVQEMLRPLMPLLRRWHLPARQCVSTLMCASDKWVTAARNSLVYWSRLMTSIKACRWESYCNIWALWTIIVWKNRIFFRMCNRDIKHFLIKSLLCNSNFRKVV